MDEENVIRRFIFFLLFHIDFKSIYFGELIVIQLLKDSMSFQHGNNLSI